MSAGPAAAAFGGSRVAEAENGEKERQRSNQHRVLLIRPLPRASVVTLVSIRTPSRMPINMGSILSGVTVNLGSVSAARCGGGGLERLPRNRRPMTTAAPATPSLTLVPTGGLSLNWKKSGGLMGGNPGSSGAVFSRANGGLSGLKFSFGMATKWIQPLWCHPRLKTTFPARGSALTSNSPGQAVIKSITSRARTDDVTSSLRPATPPRFLRGLADASLSRMQPFLANHFC